MCEARRFLRDRSLAREVYDSYRLAAMLVQLSFSRYDVERFEYDFGLA